MTVQPKTTILFDRNLILHREYWRNQLRDPEGAVGILPDFPRHSTYDGRIGEIPFVPEQSLVDNISNLARDNDLLLYTILTGCCKVTIHTYSEARRIAVGSPAKGDGVGDNALPIISYIRPGMLMRDVLSNELEALREAYKHQEWPYERMLREVGIDNELPKCPVFDIAVILTNIHGALPDVRNDITLSITRDGTALTGSIIYRTAIYTQETIERFVDHLCRTLTWAVEDPGREVADLSLIKGDEQQYILNEINNTAKPFADNSCFHTLFEEQVGRTPQAIALRYQDNTVSYLQLNTRANSLARYLRQEGLKQGQIVGICFDRSPEGIIAIFAVLKAGGIYLPLDPDYPDERLTFMVNDAQVKMILTDLDQALWLDTLDDVSIIKPGTLEVDEHAGLENLHLFSGPDDSAYLIYTSGSSGTPKGALNAHRGLCNLAAAHIDAFEVTPESNVLQFASWSFDAMASEIAMSLCSGACLCLCPTDSMLPGPPLTEVMNDQQITHVTLPPATLQYLNPDELPILSHIITAGDFCSLEQIDRWSATKVFYNAYGVTEATVCSTIAPVSTDETVSGVGRPMTNTTVYILDAKGRMMPVGVPGELYLGGEGVALGYLNRPELTATRFLPDPFRERKGARMYRSGDRGRFLADGSVELLGRIDQQIKIRGFRIEPGEIEHVLEDYPAVKKAYVTALGEDTSLTAFIEAPEHVPSPSDLARHCGKSLPHFMVPSAWHIVSTFPINPNGKIDRKALQDHAKVSRAQNKEMALPRNSLELQLVGFWEETLNVSPVGIREDFFELGGHSLLAIRLLALIQEHLKIKLSLSVFIEHPTIEQLARWIREKADQNIPWSHVVPIQPRGEQRPLFCIHPGGGNVHGYLEFARLLGDDQPVYGIQATGFEQEQQAISDIVTMARSYVDAMKTVQPTGPYAIIGWCFGARAALECAHMLHEENEAIEYLAFLDAYAPQVIPDSLKESDDATLWESLLAQETSVTAEELRMYGPEEQIAQVITLAKEADLIPEYYSKEQAEKVMEVFRANSRIVQSPLYKKYPGTLELFKAEEEAGTALLFTSDPSLGWQEVVTGPVTVRTVPGNHNTLVCNPHVETLARLVASSLKRCRKID